jgi:predicted transcriptional regulator of viral defense system
LDANVRTEHEQRLAGLAAEQHQVVTRQQLSRAVGLSQSAVDRLVASGRLIPLRRGVYTLGGCTPDLRGAIYAATAGTRVSVGSHRASAWLWRLPGREPLVEIASPRWRRVRGETIAGFPLVVHESYHLTERDCVEVDGIWRTKVDRTLVDLGASVYLGHIEPETLALAIQDAIRRNLTDVAQLETTFARLAPHIRVGAPQFREALDSFQPVLAGTESPPEEIVGRALIAAGFTVVPQHYVKLSDTWTARIDLYLPEFNRGVEVSPYSTHGGMLQMQYDTVRTLRIRRLHGIEISTVSDEEIDRGCPELIALLRTLRSAAA